MQNKLVSAAKMIANTLVFITDPAPLIACLYLFRFYLYKIFVKLKLYTRKVQIPSVE